MEHAVLYSKATLLNDDTFHAYVGNIQRMETIVWFAANQFLEDVLPLFDTTVGYRVFQSHQQFDVTFRFRNSPTSEHLLSTKQEHASAVCIMWLQTCHDMQPSYVKPKLQHREIVVEAEDIVPLITKFITTDGDIGFFARSSSMIFRPRSACKATRIDGRVVANPWWNTTARYVSIEFEPPVGTIVSIPFLLTYLEGAFKSRTEVLHLHFNNILLQADDITSDIPAPMCKKLIITT